MARLFPQEPLSTYASELAVRRALAHLDDSWRVFHSVAWQSERYGRQGDGEADFVLLHPRCGLLVLEVKGGERIDVDQGRWYSVNSQTGQRNLIKNPFEQAKDSKYALLRYLQGISPRLAAVPLAHGVVFPGATFTEDIGLYAPQALVIDAEDLLDIAAAVERLVRHWGNQTRMVQDDVHELTRRLAPTTTIRRRLSTVVAATNAELLQLTEQQKRAFHITRSQRRAAIHGGPGTGKTVLALERSLYLAADGFQVLLTCFNRPLAEKLASATGQANITATTFHSLCFTQAHEAGLYAAPVEDTAWWEEQAPTVLMEASARNGYPFDAVIIDEGQDFLPEWVEALRMALPDPDAGIFFLFYDPRQALMQPGWELPSDLDSFPLDWNCRNTLAIAEKVSGIYGDQLLPLGTEGQRPQWMRTESLDEGLATVQELVDTFLAQEGLATDQIAVLSDSRLAVSRLQRMLVSDASFVEIGYTGVVAETIYRFKGLEADVVILLFTDDTQPEEALQSLAYVGMSRARSNLVVVGPKKLRATLSWDS